MDLSVIITSYNVAPFIGTAVQSVMDMLRLVPQLKAEVLVVDYGSDDGTGDP